MNIRLRVAAQLGGLFSVLVATQMILQREILLPKFAQLERHAAIQDMDRVTQALNREADLLGASARDWGNWADAYRFMRDRNPAFVAANLTRPAIASLKINVLIYIAGNGDFVASATRDEGSAEAVGDLLAAARLSDAHPWRAAVREGRAISGFLRTPRGPLLAVLAPVLNGLGAGPQRGMVLLGRLMNDEELVRVGAQAGVTLAAEPLAPTAVPAADSTIVEGARVVQVSRDLGDVEGRALLRLRIDVLRQITANGYRAVRFAGVFVALAGAIVLLLMLWLLDRSVLSPLARMTRQVIAIGKQDDPRVRLDLRRTDELGRLAQEFDRTLDHLTDARELLAQQSFAAGVADHASGILHNLRNAMTPLTVHIGALQSTLRAAPVRDAERALAELGAGVADAARKADLEAFARLAGHEVARAVALACDDADVVANCAASIEKVLQEQSGGARAASALEFTRIPKLIEDSLALVAPDLLRNVVIDVDASLRSLGAVRIARVTLQQVVQNLINNAAESMREAGRVGCTLKITGRVVPTRTGQSLRLCFTDNGIGISPENLPRLCQKGFSTKSSASNSGIGLHWCANAIAALGGTLDFDSPGLHRGACFTVTLPLGIAADVPMTLMA
jgi:sensor domain CHASE-containing protein